MEASKQFGIHVAALADAAQYTFESTAAATPRKRWQEATTIFLRRRGFNTSKLTVVAWGSRRVVISTDQDGAD